jgi:hypothetical protein
MSDSISALPSPTLPIWNESDHDGVPDTGTLAFDELWQDKEKGLTFEDFIDIINPLQHIPVVSTIYRLITGDEIGIGARLAGGALFGGAVGFAVAGIVAGFEEASEGTIEQHVASLFGVDDAGSDAGSAVATQPQLAVVTQRPEPVTTSVPTSIPTLTTDQAAALVGARVTPAAGNPILPALARPVDTVPVSQRSFPARPSKTFLQPVPQSGEMPDKAASAQQPTEPASARLTRQIAEAQRAQAGLLIANLQASGAVPPLTSSDENAKAASEEGKANRNRSASLPFRSHPYMLPRGAPSSLVASTMERALQRYHQGLQRQNAPAPTVAPAPAPAR